MRVFYIGILRISRAEPPFSPGSMWVFPKIGFFPPKWMVKIMENPIKNGWFGGKTHHLRKTPMWNSLGSQGLWASPYRGAALASTAPSLRWRVPRRSRDWSINGGHATGWDGTTIEVVGSTKRPMMGPAMESAGIPKKTHAVFFCFWFEREGRDCLFLPFVVEFLLVMWVKSLLVAYFQWWESQITHRCFESSCSFPYILFMEEILHHLGCIKTL